MDQMAKGVLLIVALVWLLEKVIFIKRAKKVDTKVVASVVGAIFLILFIIALVK